MPKGPPNSFANKNPIVYLSRDSIIYHGSVSVSLLNVEDCFYLRCRMPDEYNHRDERKVINYGAKYKFPIAAINIDAKNITLVVTDIFAAPRLMLNITNSFNIAVSFVDCIFNDLSITVNYSRNTIIDFGSTEKRIKSINGTITHTFIKSLDIPTNGLYLSCYNGSAISFKYGEQLTNPQWCIKYINIIRDYASAITFERPPSIEKEPNFNIQNRNYIWETIGPITKDDDTCVICRSNRRTHRVLPCDHLILCQYCAKGCLLYCFQCKKAITDIVKSNDFLL